MKVKIFKHWDMEAQQEEINRWLEDNNHMIIQKTLQSTGSSGGGGSIYTIITIFYTELEFEKIK